MTLALALSSLVVWALAGQTAPGPSSTGNADEAPILDPRSCPALFGDASAVKRVEGWRKVEVAEIAPGEVLTIIHGVAAWRELVVHRRQGIRVVETALLDVEGVPKSDVPFALVEVTAPALPAGCVGGTYAVSTDDMLGDRGLVVHVDGHGALVELDGRIGWLLAAGVRPPRTRLVWASSSETPQEDPRLTAAAAATPPRTFRRRPSASRRPRTTRLAPGR